MVLPVTNAHTHLELTDLSYLCPDQPVRLQAWFRNVQWYLQNTSEGQLRASIERGIRELKACGTTHVGDVSASWESITPLLRSGLKGIVYLEVRGLRKEPALKKLENAKTAIDKVRQLPDYGPMQVGLSLHAPYSCHPELLRLGAAWCQREGVPISIHVAESPDEAELICRARMLSVHRLIGFIGKRLNRRIPFVSLQRPIRYLASQGVLDARPLIIHAVNVTDVDIELIADSKCAVVHCPRSNDRLACGRMPLERFFSAGVRVFLGTDSRASSPSLDVHAEARFAQKLHSNVINPERVEQLIYQALP